MEILTWFIIDVADIQLGKKEIVENLKSVPKKPEFCYTDLY